MLKRVCFNLARLTSFHGRLRLPSTAMKQELLQMASTLHSLPPHGSVDEELTGFKALHSNVKQRPREEEIVEQHLCT